MSSRKLGLAAAGPVSRSSVARMPGLDERLGPVAAPSYRLASRFVNRLRAGHAAHGYDELQACAVVLISAPDASVAGMVQDLAAADVDWRGKIALLCGGDLDSGSLAPLENRGAMAGSVSPITEVDGSAFVVEGPREAVREARRLVRARGTQIIELSPSGKPLYRAAVTMATGLFTPALEAAALSLRAAGLPQSGAMALAGRLFEKELRSYVHAGRRTWSGALARQDALAVRAEMTALEKLGPVARHYAESARFALELFGRDADWLEKAVKGGDR